MTPPPPTIVCVDCGETAHLLSVQGPEDEERVAVYRCSGCWDRWDVVIDAESADPRGDDAWFADPEVGNDARSSVGPAPALREGEDTDPDHFGP